MTNACEAGHRQKKQDMRLRLPIQRLAELSHSTARRWSSPSWGEVGVDLGLSPMTGRYVEGPTVMIYKMSIFEAPAGVLNGRSSG